MINYLLAEIDPEMFSTTNPLLDKNGQFVAPDTAVRNFATLWKEWNIVGKIIDKLPAIILAAVLIALGFWISKIVANIFVKAMDRRKVDFTVYNFIAKMIIILIRISVVLSALSMLFKITSLLATLSAAGVAIGLGLQDSVSQFASGVQILINHPFKKGDFVEIAGVSGNVAEIGFMQTIITTVDNKRVIIPNSDLTKNRITNYSAEKLRRVDLVFSISYSDDIAKAKTVILEAAKANVKVLSEPEPEVYVGAHSASSIDLFARFWCGGKDYWDVFFAMQENVKLAFDENGINIPFNQLDVHIIDKK